MSEMVEKVARAMAAADADEWHHEQGGKPEKAWQRFGFRDADGYVQSRWQAYTGLARAAIEALMEPAPFPRKELEAAVAQLRHAYYHLAAERVVNQRELADGLLSPAIKKLEAALSA